jgi:hypothetical protein
LKNHAGFKLTVVDSFGYGNKYDLKEWKVKILNELERRFNIYRQNILDIELKYKGDA